MKRLLGIGAVLVLLLVEIRSVEAGFVGFNNETDWTTNTDSGGPAFNGNTLTITDGGGDEHRSAFFDTKQSISAFTASFTYQAMGSADGATFTIQNEAPNALSTANGGSGVEISGMAPSAEVEFNIYGGHTIGTAYESNGANSQNYNATGNVNIASGDPILVTLSYDGATLKETLQDKTTHQTYSTSYQTDLVQVLGSSTAWIGFTGATGGAASVQTFSDPTFQNASATPEPASLTLLGLGACSLLGYGWRRRKAVTA